MNLFMNAFLSEEDRDLIGSRNVRDPLGLMAIWTYFGRKIIPNLTETSSHAMGFQLVMAGLQLYEEYCELQEKYVDQKKFFILIEQYFAFSFRLFDDHTKDYPLPGKRVLKTRPYNEIALSLKRQLVGNQLANGVWGQYRGASNEKRGDHPSSGLISIGNERDKLLVEIETGLSDECKRIVFADIKSVLTNNEDLILTEGAGKRNRQLVYGELYSLLTGLLNSDILREKLINQFPKMKALSKKMVFKGDFYRSLVEYQEQEELNLELLDDIREITICENLLALIANVFDELCSKGGTSLAAVSQHIEGKIDLSALKIAQNEFAELFVAEKSGAKKGHEELSGVLLSLKSIKEFIKTIVEYHHKLMDSRGNEPWLSIENGILVVSEKADDTDRNFEVKKAWRHDYFWGTLRNIKRTLGKGVANAIE